MNFPDIIAEYEAELVHRACQAEGFDTALTEKVLARHARHPALLDYAERRSDGVGHYVRCLGELVSRPATATTPTSGPAPGFTPWGRVGPGVRRDPGRDATVGRGTSGPSSVPRRESWPCWSGS